MSKLDFSEMFQMKPYEISPMKHLKDIWFKLNY